MVNWANNVTRAVPITAATKTARRALNRATIHSCRTVRLQWSSTTRTMLPRATIALKAPQTNLVLVRSRPTLSLPTTPRVVGELA